MKTLFSVFLVFLVGVYSDANSQSLRKVVERMLKFNPNLNAVEYDTISSRENYKMTRAELLPSLTLDFNAGSSKEDTILSNSGDSSDDLFHRTLRASLKQLIFDGSSSLNKTSASKAAFLSQQYLEKSMIEKTILDISEVYMELLRVEKQIKVAKDSVRNHRSIKYMFKERSKSGESKSNVYLVNARLQKAKITLQDRILERTKARERFKRLVGVYPASLYYPPIPSIPSRVDLSNNYDILAAEQALNSSKYLSNSAKSNVLPRVFLDAGAKIGRDSSGVKGDDDSRHVFLSGSWDLFKGHYNKAERNRAKFQVGKHEELYRAAVINANQDLKVLIREMHASNKSIELSKNQYINLNKLVKGYKEEFKIGNQRLINILDTQEDYYNARKIYYDSSFNRDVSVFRIKAMQGRLGEYFLGKKSYNNLAGSKIGVDEDNNYNIKSNKKERNPVSQVALMRGDFKKNIKSAKHENVHHEYYHTDRSSGDDTLFRNPFKKIKLFNNARKKANYSPIFKKSEKSKLPIFIK